MAKKKQQQTQPMVTDLELASQLLDAAGAPSATTLPLRLVEVAQKWLGRAAHSGGCLCVQCIAARRLLQKAMVIGVLKTPVSFVMETKPKTPAPTTK